MSEKELTAKQVAQLYKVSPSTARAWFLQGLIPGARLKETEVGSFWVVAESKLASFVQPQAGRPSQKSKTTKRAAKSGPEKTLKSR